MAESRQDKQSRLREMFAANKGKVHVPDLKYLAIREMADIYESLLVTYNGSTTFKKSFKRKIEPKSTSYSTLVIALKFAEELEVDSETYVKGIFYFHKMLWENSPKVRDLGSFRTKITAKDKVKRYLFDLKNKPSLKGKNIVSIVSNKKIVIPDKVVCQNSDKQLKAFMTNHNISEEEVFIRYCQGNDALLYFSKIWLLNNITFISLKRDKKI